MPQDLKRVFPGGPQLEATRVTSSRLSPYKVYGNCLLTSHSKPLAAFHCNATRLAPAPVLPISMSKSLANQTPNYLSGEQKLAKLSSHLGVLAFAGIEWKVETEQHS